MSTRRILYLALMIFVISLLAFTGCGSTDNNEGPDSTKTIPSLELNEVDPVKRSSEYVPFLSMGDNCVVYQGPWNGVKNDALLTDNTELHVGDFLRFPETVEVGEIIKVLRIERECAVIEYTFYSRPPAPEEYKAHEFQVCRAD